MDAPGVVSVALLLWERYGTAVEQRFGNPAWPVCSTSSRVMSCNCSDRSEGIVHAFLTRSQFAERLPALRRARADRSASVSSS